MPDKQDYRHEWKYLLNYSQYLALRSRLRPVMRPDPHAGPEGTYQIRSIYWDSYADTALREKIDGLAQREKFRVRYYDDDLSHIFLEKKIKNNNLCLKLSAPVTAQECRRLLDGDWVWMANHVSPLVVEFYTKLSTRQLRPRVLVSYRREPYIYAPGNVRITFDSHIRTSLFSREFLLPQRQQISAEDKPGDMVLEVKYDAFLPDVIFKLLQTPGLRQQAFSKYGACRRFG